MTISGSPMLDALHASEPYAAHADKLRLYGQFVGSWAAEIEYRQIDGPTRRAEGEWHFGWVLEGRAIQDVWIFPSRKARARDGASEEWHFYGSTLRIYDPAIDAWHITFFEPTRPFEVLQIGQPAGADIVQIGQEVDGITRRWRFVDITDRSFTWLGELSRDKASTWQLEMEMRARRH